MNWNDKALVRLMKSAYKGTGVKVYRTEQDALFLHGGFWAAAMPYSNVPGSVLGQLACWLHGLPRQGEALWLIYDDPQPRPLDGTLPELGALTTAARPLEDLKLTNVICGKIQAVQQRSGVIRWFDACAVQTLGSLPAWGGELLCAADGTLWGRWADADTGTVFWLETLDHVPAALSETLGAYNFWQSGTEAEP